MLRTAIKGLHIKKTISRFRFRLERRHDHGKYKYLDSCCNRIVS